jgi:hypothetical protein
MDDRGVPGDDDAVTETRTAYYDRTAIDNAAFADHRKLATIGSDRAAIVVAVTSLATTLGARASGVAASFPWIGGALAVFAHRAQGAAAEVAVLRGMAIALYGFLAFFAVLGFVLTRMNLPLAFVAATAAALAVQTVTLRFVHGETRAMASAKVPPGSFRNK